MGRVLQTFYFTNIKKTCVQQCKQGFKYKLKRRFANVLHDLRCMYGIKRHYEHTLKISECKLIRFYLHSYRLYGKQVIKQQYLCNGIYTNPKEHHHPNYDVHMLK